jgi:hypothetical protein
MPYDKLGHGGVDPDWAKTFQDRSEELHERFGILSRAELGTLPHVEPLIENTLDRRSMALLAGYWGSGKSFLALDWACCVATGTPCGVPERCTCR